MSVFYCPQCGCETRALYEGYCLECRDENQSQLDQHWAQYNHWGQLSDDERDKAIRNACR